MLIYFIVVFITTQLTTHLSLFVCLSVTLFAADIDHFYAGRKVVKNVFRAIKNLTRNAVNASLFQWLNRRSLSRTDKTEDRQRDRDRDRAVDASTCDAVDFLV